MRFEQFFAATVLITAAGLGANALRAESPPGAGAAIAVPVTTTPLPLNRDDPAQDSIGALKFMGAVQIRSTDARFGGISGLRAGAPTPGGVQMLAITDTGNWLAFTTVEAGGRLAGVADMIMVPLPQPGGKPALTKSAVDAEAVEWDPATGAAMVAYEQDHRFAWFTGIDPARPASLDAPPVRTEHLTEMIAWPANNGAEASALLPDGTRIAIAESTLRPDGSRAALLTRQGVTREIGITGVDGFSPTDAIALDATTLLVLHRRFSPLGGVGTALTRVDLAPVLGTAIPTAPLESRLLARWEAPLTLDNMEGLALVRSGGRTFVYLVSDDNLNSLQRTLLMKFELIGSR
jgi:hypothetical protein